MTKTKSRPKSRPKEITAAELAVLVSEAQGQFFDQLAELRHRFRLLHDRVEALDRQAADRALLNIELFAAAEKVLQQHERDLVALKAELAEHQAIPRRAPPKQATAAPAGGMFHDCPPEGRGPGDPDLSRLKNRDDDATDPIPIDLSAILAWEFPRSG